MQDLLTTRELLTRSTQRADRALQLTRKVRCQGARERKKEKKMGKNVVFGTIYCRMQERGKEIYWSAVQFITVMLDHHLALCVDSK